MCIMRFINLDFLKNKENPEFRKLTKEEIEKLNDIIKEIKNV